MQGLIAYDSPPGSTSSPFAFSTPSAFGSSSHSFAPSMPSFISSTGSAVPSTSGHSIPSVGSVRSRSFFEDDDQGCQRTGFESGTPTRHHHHHSMLHQPPSISNASLNPFVASCTSTTSTMGFPFTSSSGTPNFESPFSTIVASSSCLPAVTTSPFDLLPFGSLPMQQQYHHQQKQQPTSGTLTSMMTKPELASPIKKRKPNDVNRAAAAVPIGASPMLVKRKRGIEEAFAESISLGSDESKESARASSASLLPSSSAVRAIDWGASASTSGSSGPSTSIEPPASETPNTGAQKHVKAKLGHKEPDAKDIPKVRLVYVRAAPSPSSSPSAGPEDLVAGKILYKEPWGVMVVLTESRPDLGMKRGQRFWTKFTGTVHPISNIPILEAIHTC